MSSSTFAIAVAAALAALATTTLAQAQSARADGYRGIWYRIANRKADVAYSGGLGTYPPHVRPMAVYDKAANQTFFVYGGAAPDNDQNLRILIGSYDHKTGLVSRPTVIRDCGDFSDAHANPSLMLDAAGHLWVFAAQRHQFDGKIVRSVKPHSIDAFEEVGGCAAYPQPWALPKMGLFLLETKYTGGRETYWRTRPDGGDWSPQRQLTHEGHYASSFADGRTLYVALDWHNRSSDWRTNLYLIKTADAGRTWTTIDGKPLETPLAFPVNPALIRDYHAEKRYIFLNDVKVDRAGNAMVLCATSGGGAYQPGPRGDPRRWTLARFDGKAWSYHEIAPIDHNYDYGNLHVEADGTLVAIGPTDPGPQPGWCGGEMVLWTSRDQGRTWSKKPLTAGSARNHTFARIPLNAHEGFFAFWADGDPTKPSPSDLYFATRDGAVFRLPRQMDGDTARPEPLPRPRGD